MPQPEKRTVMFVDDERDLLLSLRASLRRERRIWDMRFVEGAEEALEELRRRPAEIVVTDMQMPRMDGAEFLERVRAESLASARIVLSGQADESATMRAVRYAHQWLAKPIDRDTLSAILGDAFVSLDIVSRGPAHDLVSSASDLPVLPRIFRELTEALGDPGVSIEEIARIVASDPAAAARTLQLANSAFFGLPRPMDSIEEAVKFLGLSTLSRLVLAAEAMRAFGSDVDTGLFERLVTRANAVSTVATALCPADDKHGTATTAGLLHLIGVLLLSGVARHASTYTKAAGSLSTAELVELERSLFDTTHAEVGAALLSIWGVPHDLSDAVGRHLSATPEHRGLHDPALAVRLARSIVEQELALRAGGEPEPSGLADEEIAVIGGSAELERISALARTALSSSASRPEAA